MEASESVMREATARPKVRKRCSPKRAAAKNRSCYSELGVGGFGVVLTTDDPKVVVKLTTDRSEAQFAAVSIVHDLRFRGVVRYDYAVRMPVDVHVEGWQENPGLRMSLTPATASPMSQPTTRAVARGAGHPLYALWRERATKVGQVGEVHFYDPALVRREWSEDRDYLYRPPPPLPAGVKPVGGSTALRGAVLPPFWAKVTGIALEIEKAVPADPPRPRQLPPDPAMAVALAGVRDAFRGRPAQWREEAALVAVSVAEALREARYQLHIVEEYERGNVVVARGIEDYLDAGILLGDVEGRNLGLVRRTPTLIDPSSTVFLGERYKLADQYLERAGGERAWWKRAKGPY